MRISEIFRSIQGEGLSQGLITTFVRLAGCNLSCSWCDTPYAREGGKEVPVADVFQAVEFSSCARVCITGGEPLVQKEELGALVQKLDEAGYEVEIETNGTIDFSPLQPHRLHLHGREVPLLGRGERSLPPFADPVGDAVKFVVNGTADLDYAREVIASHPIAGEYLISPVYGSDYGCPGPGGPGKGICR